MHLPGLEAAEKLAQLASACQRFTPRVSLVPPDGLLLEVQGSLHLFAGVAGLAPRSPTSAGGCSAAR